MQINSITLESRISVIIHVFTRVKGQLSLINNLVLWDTGIDTSLDTNFILSTNDLEIALNTIKQDTFQQCNSI